MALAGIFVECGLASSADFGNVTPVYIGQPNWSENKTTAGTTTNAVPAASTYGPWVLSIVAAADSFVAIGSSPNASAEPRRFVPASTRVDIMATTGDKVNWAAA